MKKVLNRKGFTLIELIVVIAIIGILVAIAVPRFSNVFARAKITADQATVRALNSSTQMLRLSAPVNDPFENNDNSSDTLMGKLVNGGYLGAKVTPQTEDAEFEWLFDDETWRLMFENSFYVITLGNFDKWKGNQVEIDNGGKLIGIYIGSSKDIVIPQFIGDQEILEIYQDTYSGVGLVAVNFDDDSQLTRINARAFRKNNLTTVDFPDTIESIDTYSFYKNTLSEINLSSSLTTIQSHAFAENELTEIKLPDNLKTIGTYAFEGNDNLTKITIGEGVNIGNGAFGKFTDDFISVYNSAGAGTYSLEDGIWGKVS